MPKQELLVKYGLLPFSDVSRAVWYDYYTNCVSIMKPILCHIFSNGNLKLFSDSMQKNQVSVLLTINAITCSVFVITITGFKK